MSDNKSINASERLVTTITPMHTQDGRVVPGWFYDKADPNAYFQLSTAPVSGINPTHGLETQVGP